MVLGFIRDYIADAGWSPSYREIADACGLTVSTVHWHLHVLEKEKKIKLGGGPRQIRVL